jgi:hypothetical protein
MNTQWIVAKYMRDLKRREPQNVGVLLRVGDLVLSKFKGERPDRTINGQLVKGWVGDLNTYKAWVEYWRRTVSPEWDIKKLTRVRSGAQNYFLEFGGERLVGNGKTHPEDLLDDLYQLVVEEESEPEISVRGLSESVFERLAIQDRVKQDCRITVPSAGGGSGADDQLFFDFRFDNGAMNLFQAISLTYPDGRTWMHVHAAAWAFEKVSAYQGERPKQMFALVKARKHNAEAERQMGLLARHAEVLDVAAQDDATAKLAAFLHIHR